MTGFKVRPGLLEDAADKLDGLERTPMDPLPDIDERVNEIAADAAREYLATQRAKPGATGRSPDGTVEVTVDGLGDVTDVRVHAPDVPPEVAARLAAAMKAAWTAAARAHAVAETGGPLARQAGLAEQINERFGPPPHPAPRAAT